MTKPEHFLLHFPLVVRNTQTLVVRNTVVQTAARQALSCSDSSSSAVGWTVHKLVLSVSERLRVYSYYSNKQLKQWMSKISSHLPAFCTTLANSVGWCFALWNSTSSNVFAHLWLVWATAQPLSLPSPPVCFSQSFATFLFLLIGNHSLFIFFLWHSNHRCFFLTWWQLSLSLIALIWSMKTVTWLNVSSR